MKRRFVFSALSLLIATGICGWMVLGQERTNPIEMTAESVEIGEGVFVEYCAGCHGRRADGRGRQSLNLNPKPQNLRNAPFVKYLTDERLYSSIAGGVRGTSMPAFDLILDQDRRWHVINYIRSLTAHYELDLPNAIVHRPISADATSPVAMDDAVVAIGKQKFSLYCVSCHGENGDGKGPVAANLVPAPRNLLVIASWGQKPFIDYLSDARLYDSIANGVPGTSMQPWGGVFADQEVWEIIQFLRFEASQQKEDIAIGQ